MEGVDYNVVFQDYLDDAARLRIDFLKTFTRIKENSMDIEKLRTRAESRDATLARYNESHRYSELHPQTSAQAAKIDKEIKTSLLKCEDSQSRLRQLKRSFELRIKKMDQESLVWDPTARNQLESSFRDATLLAPSPVKSSMFGEKRKASHSGSINLPHFPKFRHVPSGRHLKKIPRHRILHDSSDLSQPIEVDAPPIQFDTSLAEDESKIYCICNRPSFGEMIGCDNEVVLSTN
ncbi:Histone acetyltransferase complex subunit [Entomophthora muscae]|uniref:Histone acetyltransferase complex subunit n=1 Tax=Entomophthora muscae TaxID=34485 RepID=A0ACC2UFC7_9FUNG|nr:Histone acetyltransferase complex subunit [Entomophthora muscae]